MDKNELAKKAVEFWTAVKCILSLRHFNGGVFQCEAGNWHCKHCNRLVGM